MLNMADTVFIDCFRSVHGTVGCCADGAAGGAPRVEGTGNTDEGAPGGLVQN